MEPKPYTGCIYLAMNVVTGIGYIGKTNRDLETRRKHHENIAKRGLGAAFAAALREYGPQAFEWSALYMSDDDPALLAAEMEIIAWYGRDRLYNLCAGGQGPTGVVWTDERRRSFSNGRKGMKFSESHRAAMSACRESIKMPPWTEERRDKHRATWAAKHHTHSDETKAKMSAAAKARCERDGHDALSAAGKKGAAARWGNKAD